MIVLLELLTALLEYIDLILQLSFFQQEFILLYKYLTYYAGIMLNAFRYLLCSKLCQHNRRVPNQHVATSYPSMQKAGNPGICLHDVLAVSARPYTWLNTDLSTYWVPYGILFIKLV